MWVDVEQNSDEWFVLRMKKATSSHFPSIMANDGKAFGDPAIKYASKVALEIVTGMRDERTQFKNSYMDDGNEMEPEAVELYEIEKFVKTTNGGFYHRDRLGDSPDRNVGEDGCVEVKCVIANQQFKRLEKGGFDTAYKWQIQGHIWLGEKQWCDFVSYCPEMPESKQLYVHRVHRDEDMIDRMKKRLKLFFEEVDRKVELLRH